MTRADERQIELLNDLIAITIDSAEGYATAASRAAGIRFQCLFDARASQRRQLTAELQVEVFSLGGEPRDQGTFLATGHRMFLVMKQAVGRSDQRDIDDIENCECYIMDRYGASLQDSRLTEAITVILTKAFERIKSDHNHICDLKRELISHLYTI